MPLPIKGSKIDRGSVANSRLINAMGFCVGCADFMVPDCKIRSLAKHPACKFGMSNIVVFRLDQASPGFFSSNQINSVVYFGTFLKTGDELRLCQVIRAIVLASGNANLVSAIFL